MFKSANVTVMVSDLDRSVWFYTQTLGFTLKYQVPGHWAEVELPGLTVGLHPGRTGGPGLEKSEPLSIGLAVDDMGQAIEMLESRGVVFAGEPRQGKATEVVYFGDPDGNSLYLFQMR